MRVTRVIRIIEEADIPVPFGVDEDGRKYITNPGQAHLSLRKAEYVLASKDTTFTVHCEDENGCTTMTFSDKEF